MFKPSPSKNQTTFALNKSNYIYEKKDELEAAKQMQSSCNNKNKDEVENNNMNQIDLVEELTRHKMEALQKVSDYQKENLFLKSNIEKHIEEHSKVVTHYREQIHTLKTKEIPRLKKEIDDLSQTHNHKYAVIQKQTKLEIQKIQDESFQRECELRDELCISQEEVRDLSHFREIKEMAEEKMIKLEKMIQTLQDKCKQDKVESERRNLNDLTKMKNQCESKISDITSKARMRARQEYGEMVTSIMEGNKAISEQLRSQIKIVEGLQTDKENLTQQVNRLKIELDLQKDREAQYANQTYNHLKEKTNLNNKITLLEQELQYIKDKHSKQQQHQQQGKNKQK